MKKINFEENELLESLAIMDNANEILGVTTVEAEANKTKADVLDVIMKFWPYIKPVLSVAKVFTNDKIDALINAVIAWGNEYTQSED